MVPHTHLYSPTVSQLYSHTSPFTVPAAQRFITLGWRTKDVMRDPGANKVFFSVAVADSQMYRYSPSTHSRSPGLARE